MTSEVTSDLKFELSGLSNPCSSITLASKGLYWTNLPEEEERSQISSIDLLASPQVKTEYCWFTIKCRLCDEVIKSVYSAYNDPTLVHLYYSVLYQCITFTMTVPNDPSITKCQSTLTLQRL